MVPVELTLTNFLSYGAIPQTLDFSQFHVACLSGKNGQGKSALLDAITWVLWGEARKSSGGHKPDEELLRIGTRRMKVELVFDVEGVRYRVMRAYSRSATGKTSKAEMEIQVLDDAGTEGRPITQSSIRESQAHLNGILGLDYHTFINSAFLLQGRSDEFTKKKPSERKDILGRILNLGKYDRLAAMARDRQRKLGDQIDQVKREIDRLTLAIEHEPESKHHFAEVAEKIEQQQLLLNEARAQESALVEQLGGLEAQEKASEAMVASIAQLKEQFRLQDEERLRLTAKIDTAKDLVSRKEEVESRYEQFNALVEERELLDAGREVHRGLERQLEQKKNELGLRRSEIEQRIQHLLFEQKVNKDSLAEIDLKLAGKKKLEEDLKTAEEASQRVEAAKEQILARDQLKEQINLLERQIAGKRESVASTIANLRERCSLLTEGLHAKVDLEKEKARLDLQAKKLTEATAGLEQLTLTGQQAGEKMKSLEGEVQALSQEKSKLEIQFAQLEDLATATCPTCGNDLTSEHRENVLGQIGGELAEVKLRITSNTDAIQAISKERDDLRSQFRTMREEIGALEGTTQQLGSVQERLSNIEQKKEELNLLQAQLSEAQTKLSGGNFAKEEHEQLGVLKGKITDLGNLDDELEADRFKANQVLRYQEHLRVILHAEGRKESILAQLELQDKQIEQARFKIDSGKEILLIREEITRLNDQLEKSGFNAARFEEVRLQIKKLAGAQSEFKDLLNAQQNVAEWEEQRGRILTQLQNMETDISEQQKQYDALLLVLGDKVQLEKRLLAFSQNRAEIEKITQGLQVQSGELSAKLEQAKADRGRLKESRSRLKELRGEENLYSKLRRAFGKQGIPSLIIEQSLPEIEERANDLLVKLAEGKMRVNLETLKDKKSGGTKETLEIIITDEQGVPRPYETFSGGEAFRVNFAIRIALSQMLAERSGVRVRTLGIDEGFGTQDQEGIQNLIEALQVIQEDFDKIIVITHLERLKEAFPVRIEVVKHPVEGSKFTLIQN